MHQLIRSLVKDGPVVTDGAWGTELQAMGLAAGTSPEAWNLTCPERVQEIAAAYVAAGSRIILSNTFGGNRYIQQKYNLADRIAEINRQGVAISRRAAQGTGTLVFGSIGPSGRKPAGTEKNAADLQAAFIEQARALAEAGADGLVIETMTGLEEALIAIAAARKTGLPVVVCMTFVAGGRADLAVTAKVAAREFEAAGVDVVGANCGQGVEDCIRICQQMRTATGLPIWLKPNAGLPRFVDGKPIYPIGPADFAAYLPQLIGAGADFIGGCCGAGPAHIRAVQEAVDQIARQTRQGNLRVP